MHVISSLVFANLAHSYGGPYIWRPPIFFILLSFQYTVITDLCGVIQINEMLILYHFYVVFDIYTLHTVNIYVYDMHYKYSCVGVKMHVYSVSLRLWYVICITGGDR